MEFITGLRDFFLSGKRRGNTATRWCTGWPIKEIPNSNFIRNKIIKNFTNIDYWKHSVTVLVLLTFRPQSMGNIQPIQNNFYQTIKWIRCNNIKKIKRSSYPIFEIYIYQSVSYLIVKVHYWINVTSKFILYFRDNFHTTILQMVIYQLYEMSLSQKLMVSVFVFGTRSMNTGRLKPRQLWAMLQMKFPLTTTLDYGFIKNVILMEKGE